MKDAIYENVTNLLTSADEAIICKNDRKALEIVDQAITDLSDHYVTKNTVDDKPLKLTLAQVKYSQGSLNEAFNLKKSVLISRLECIKIKHVISFSL